jgi:ubiquinone/menaquinone biosynthesis C-methylase UbiE
MFLLLQRKVYITKLAFSNALTTPVWLGMKDLELMLERYPFQFIARDDPEILSQRGWYKAKEILKLVKSKKKEIINYLELGCNDGMVCYFLNLMKKKAVGIDIDSKSFDKQATMSGTRLIKMDASDLHFEDDQFDFIYSYNAFEHFLEPEKTLREAIRVVKKNGYLFLSFEPLYTSPWGLHAWKSIPIPYCQFFFPDTLIEEFSRKSPSPSLNSQLNKWSIEDFRALWKRYSNSIEIVKYNEFFNINHLDLILEHPSCFKSKTTLFDNLIVKKISILFRKIN